MELVNHPEHYKKQGRKECIEEIADYGQLVLDIFCLTNAYKYLYRAGEKENNSKEQDIAKAKWYIKYFEDSFSFANMIYGEDYKNYINPIANDVYRILEKLDGNNKSRNR